jgi:hypothetical protein
VSSTTRCCRHVPPPAPPRSGEAESAQH